MSNTPKTNAAERPKAHILTTSHLSHDVILRLEFQQYYASIRKINALSGTVVVFALYIAFTILSYLQGDWIVGILHSIFCLLCFVIFLLSYSPKLKHRYDLTTGGLILLALSLATIDVAVHSQSSDLFIVVSSMMMAVFFCLQLRYIKILLCFSFLPLLTAAVVHKYETIDDTHLTVVNFVIYFAFTGAAYMAVMTYEKMEFARYKSQLKVHRAQTVMKMQQARSAALLENLFPPRIRSFVEAHDAQAFNEASVVFADLENFQELSSSLAPKDYITLLNQVFACLDELTEKHGLLKVKTTGEVYMAVASIPTHDPRGALSAVSFSLDGLERLHGIANRSGFPLRPRFGVNTGFVVAGTLHTSKLTFDIYGDAVNVAHRMMYHGVPGAVQISDNTLKLLPFAVRQQAGPDEHSSERHASEHRLSERYSSERFTARSNATQVSEDANESGNFESIRLSERSVALEDAEAQAMCRGWVLHPRGKIALKNHGTMRAFLVSKAGELELPGDNAPAASLGPPSLAPASSFVSRDGSTEGVEVAEVPFGSVQRVARDASEAHLAPPSPAMSGETHSLVSSQDAQGSPTLSGAALSGGEPSGQAECRMVPVPPTATQPKSTTPQPAPSPTAATWSPAPTPTSPLIMRQTSRASGLGSGSLIASTANTAFSPPHKVDRRSAPPSVNASRISRRTHGSSSQGTTSLQEVLDQVVDYCDDSSDVFAELRQNALDSMGEDNEEAYQRKQEKKHKAPAALSPDEMVANVRSFRPQMKWMWVFRDQAANRKYFDKSLTEKRKPCMIVFVYAFLFNIVFIILGSFLIPTALPFHITQGALLGISAVHIVLFALKCVRPRALGLINMVLLFLWAVTLIVELGFVRQQTFRQKQQIVYDLFFIGRATFHWIICNYTWCPVLSHIWKYIVSYSSCACFLAIYGTTGKWPTVHITILLIAVLVMVTFASALYAVNTRLGFLQGDWMHRAMTEVKETSRGINTILESSLPGPVLERLKRSPKAVSQSIPSASVFFADFVSFTEFCAAVPSVFVVQLLDEVYARFDQLCKMNGCSQIALIGDCYFAGAGVLTKDDAHMLHAVRAASEMQQEMRRYNKEKGTSLALRIGLSTGPVFAGVLGVTRFTYDVWGPAVIDAKRIEGASQPNRILVAHAIKEALAPAFRFRSGPRVNRHRTYFLSSSAPTAPDASPKPNAKGSKVHAKAASP